MVSVSTLPVKEYRHRETAHGSLFDRRLLAFALIANLAGAVEPPQLGTRKLGDDWPQLLGPTGDNRSRETGIITEWNATSPKLVWQMPLGTGYGTPAISRGRLFQFHRVADQARLVCLNSETGTELWKFEYPSDYQDLYGYDTAAVVARGR